MYQAHSQTNGGVVRDPGQRITFKGYTWNTYGENIYAYASSVFYGHAGLNVDWGPGVGGTQSPPGHRNNIQAAAFREIGIGVVDGVNGSVGADSDAGSRHTIGRGSPNHGRCLLRF